MFLIPDIAFANPNMLSGLGGLWLLGVLFLLLIVFSVVCLCIVNLNKDRSRRSVILLLFPSIVTGLLFFVFALLLIEDGIPHKGSMRTTFFWLLIPGVVLLMMSVLSYFRHKRRIS